MNILLTGATGYIGRRLIETLLEDGSTNLRLFVRNKNKVNGYSSDRITISEGDTFDKNSLKNALKDIDTTYYLIHSMGAKGNFEDLDRISAENFLEACIQNRVKRIIYLGGLGEKETASRHLRSRLETGEILSSKPDQIQTIWFRAGIIIGSGSASFEIIRNLVQKIPLMTTPKWVRTKTQPISIKNVIEYLCLAKDLAFDKNLVVDIGSEVMSFKKMLLGAAKVMDLKRHIIIIPFFSPKLSSYWLVLITPVGFKLAKSLVEGLKSETIFQNENAKIYFPQVIPIPYERSFSDALEEIEKKQVISRWCDSSAQETCDAIDQDNIGNAVYLDKISQDLKGISEDKVFHSILALGGKNGWLKYDWLWQLRGFLDKILGGPGLHRGRRDPASLRIGDSLDFWKVADLEENKRLLLSNQMKVPGKAWLEFTLENNQLIQTAYFLPKGLWGRIYWWSTKPFHSFIFPAMARAIIQRAERMTSAFF
ncbi:MAG: SDR family oxidoreductase [Candidatus Aminicenantes bacterium]|nr:SDR family oxidoreductase [Candidatus Aminicenantes bacterium]